MKKKVYKCNNHNTALERICSYIEFEYGLKISGLNADKLLDWISTHLEQLANEDIDQLIDNNFIYSFLNNESYFFRIPEQFGLIKNLGNKKQKLKILSLGCSHGQEAYSCAISLNETTCSYHIIGIDIDKEAIEVARNGKYTKYAIRAEKTILQQYFDKLDNYYNIKDAYQQNTSFHHLNILKQSTNSIFNNEQFDIILCNNILIYHTDTSENKLVRKLHQLLKPGGIFLTSKEESCSKIIIPKFIMKTFMGLKYFIKPDLHLAFNPEYRELFENNNTIEENQNLYDIKEINYPEKEIDLIHTADQFFTQNSFTQSFHCYYKLLTNHFDELYIQRMVASLENLNMIEDAKKWQYTHLLTCEPDKFQLNKYLDLCIKTKDMDEYCRIQEKIKQITH